MHEILVPTFDLDLYDEPLKRVRWLAKHVVMDLRRNQVFVEPLI